MSRVQVLALPQIDELWHNRIGVLIAWNPNNERYTILLMSGMDHQIQLYLRQSEFKIL